jgi:hypothetical protein
MLINFITSKHTFYARKKMYSLAMELFDAIDRAKRVSASRAASYPESETKCETIMTDGLFISRPVKKATEKEPIITKLGEDYHERIQSQASKAGSVTTGVYKVKAIHDFMFQQRY